MDSPVGRALLRLTGLSLAAVALVGLFVPRSLNVAHRPEVVVPVSLGLVVLAVIVRVPRSAKNAGLPVATAVGGAVVAGAVGLMTGYRYGWDARVVMDMAGALQSGRPLSAHDYQYLSLFPNNLPLLAIDRMGIAVAQAFSLSTDAVLVPLNALCVGVTLYAVHVIAARVCGRGPALAAQLVTLALVGTSPWLAVPYTDFYAMPFVAGGVALAVKALAPGPRVARVALWVLSLVAVAVAYTIKTTPVVIAVAGVLAAVVAIFDHDLQPARRAGVLVACAVSMVAVVGIGVGLSDAATSVSGVDSSRVDASATPPLLWWVALGADEQRAPGGVVSYGAYSREMVDAVTDRDPQQMRAYAAGFLGARWAERGLGGTIAFYGNKAAWNWGDGMFWAWGEGPDSLPGTLPPATGLTGVVHELNGFHGSAYAWRADLAQALWLAVLLVAGLGLLRAPYRRETLLVALCVLGIAGFTVVLQGRSRYLFAFVPVVVSLAAMVHARLPRRASGRRTPLVEEPR